MTGKHQQPKPKWSSFRRGHVSPGLQPTTADKRLQLINNKSQLCQQPHLPATPQTTAELHHAPPQHHWGPRLQFFSNDSGKLAADTPTRMRSSFRTPDFFWVNKCKLLDFFCPDMLLRHSRHLALFLRGHVSCCSLESFISCCIIKIKCFACSTLKKKFPTSASSFSTYSVWMHTSMLLFVKNEKKRVL